MELSTKLYILDSDGKKFMGAGVLWLLERVEETGSLLSASKSMGLSYTKARAMLERDRKIISLRESIRSSGEDQYRDGVITMTDLMSRIDDEYNARATENVHRIQLLMAIYDLRNCMGY